MENHLFDLLLNKPLISAVIAWALAQILKAFHARIFLKEFHLERLIGPGGMPSSHSATVVALMVTIGRQEGLASPLFAIAFALALIVMYDAMSVRRQAGEHAKALNIIIQQMLDENQNSDQRLHAFKEVLGHTPLQVLAGIVLGVVVGFLMPMG